MLAFADLESGVLLVVTYSESTKQSNPKAKKKNYYNTHTMILSIQERRHEMMLPWTSVQANSLTSFQTFPPKVRFLYGVQCAYLCQRLSQLHSDKLILPYNSSSLCVSLS